MLEDITPTYIYRLYTFCNPKHNCYLLNHKPFTVTLNQVVVIKCNYLHQEDLLFVTTGEAGLHDITV